MSEQNDIGVGLEQITVQTQPDIVSARFPMETIAPSNPQFELQLEEVLYVPASLEERLLKALQPRITHRDLQRPHIFHSMLDQVLQNLSGRFSRMAPSRERNKLHKVIDTLKKAKTLYGLLRRFQHALHRA